MDELLHLFSSWVKISMFMKKKNLLMLKARTCGTSLLHSKKEISLLKFLIHLYLIFPLMDFIQMQFLLQSVILLL